MHSLKNLKLGPLEGEEDSERWRSTLSLLLPPLEPSDDINYNYIKALNTTKLVRFVQI